MTADGTTPAILRAESATPLALVPDSAPVMLVDLAPRDIMWLDDLRDHLRPKGTPVIDAPTLSACFDHYNSQWCTAAPTDRWNPHYLITAIGVALGDLLIAQIASARWQRVDETHATTVAVRLEERRVTVFPIDAVARRWHAEQRAWIEAWRDEMVLSG